MSVVTIFASCEYAYYDGLLAFAQGCYVGDGRVWWLGEELPRIEPTCAAAGVPEEPRE